jgi:hypothetical protein
MLTTLDFAKLEWDTYSVSPAGTVFDTGLDRAVVTRTGNDVLISIRGTKDAKQWVSNFKIVGVRSATHPRLGVCEQGFLDGAAALWAIIKPTLKPGDVLTIQGHSRGAGMVPIIVGMALLDGFHVAYALMWEAPWCVGHDCRTFLISRGIYGLQMWHGDDPVPTIPAVPWLVSNVWPIKHFGKWRLDPFDCHAMAGIVAELMPPTSSAKP